MKNWICLMMFLVPVGAYAIDFDLPVKIEKHGSFEQVVGEDPARSLLVCQNPGSTLIYLYNEGVDSTLAAGESRSRLQFRNGYVTLAAYATGQADPALLDAYVSHLPADDKVDCARSVIEQVDKLDHLLTLIARQLPWYRPLTSIPNFKIIRGWGLTIDPRDNPRMPNASCVLMTVEQINESLRSPLTYFTVGDFAKERFCK